MSVQRMVIARRRNVGLAILATFFGCADLVGADFDGRSGLTPIGGDPGDPGEPDAGFAAPESVGDGAASTDAHPDADAHDAKSRSDANFALDAPLAPIVPSLQVGAGWWFTCSINGNGTRCWGDMLGNGATPPKVIIGPLSAVALTVGASHVCARTGTGALLCAGSNKYLQLAQSDASDGEWPATAIPGLAGGARDIAAGWYHSCAIDQNGALWCWGTNKKGQLGDGTTTSRPTPQIVTGMGSGVTAVAAGAAHTCAIQGGALLCWGDNAEGALGNGLAGVAGQRLVPTPVTNMASGIESVSAGLNHTCAIKTGGTLFCWGENGDGRLGDLTTDDRYEPVEVTSLSNVTTVRAGSHHTCALVGGTAYCWGYNAHGQLGDGTTDTNIAPRTVVGLSGLVAISAGHAHSCAMTANDAVHCWGSNEHGEVGSAPNSCGTFADGGAKPCARTPVLVSGL